MYYIPITEIFCFQASTKTTTPVLAHTDSTPQKSTHSDGVNVAKTQKNVTPINPHFYNSTGKAQSQTAAMENSQMNQIWKLSNQARKDNT